MTSLRARQINRDIRHRDALVFDGVLANATAAHERAMAEAVVCPHCTKPVHPSNHDAHMERYHKGVLLAQCESIIDNGLKIFMQVGQALQTINEQHLYAPEYDTFEDYCERRWNISRQRGYQLMTAAGIAAKLSTNVDIDLLPEHESHIRPLSGLPDEALIPVWMVIRDTAPGGKITGAHVKSVTNVAKEMIKTGAIDDGTGKSVRVADVFNVNVIEETYERAARQKAHIVANSKRERVLSAEATVHAIANEDDAVTLKIRLPKGTDMSAIRDAWFNHKPLFVTVYAPKDDAS